MERFTRFIDWMLDPIFDFIEDFLKTWRSIRYQRFECNENNVLIFAYGTLLDHRTIPKQLMPKILIKNYYLDNFQLVQNIDKRYLGLIQSKTGWTKGELQEWSLEGYIYLLYREGCPDFYYPVANRDGVIAFCLQDYLVKRELGWSEHEKYITYYKKRKNVRPIEVYQERNYE